MWIVRLALARPYTFVVMAILIVIGGVVAVESMATDILPEIDIPVIAAVWQYQGLPAEDVEQRITSTFERAATTTVNGIEHIESQTIAGWGVVKVFFHPGTNIAAANAQVTAIAQTILKQLPPGITPPLILQYSASNVPVIQASVHSDTLGESELFDLTSNFLRIGLATVQGAQMPFPFGGKQRQVMVDIDLPRLQALGLSPIDVSNAVNLQNLILPSGTTKQGTQEISVRLNSSPDALKEISAMPIKTVNGVTVTIGDVAQVHDGFTPQTSLVRADGQRGVLISILKAGGSSTLDVVSRVRAAMPQILTTLPPSYHLDFLFDQSVFVRASVNGVIREAAIAAGLTGLMILLFLGSWRSTLIVVISIPLSILVSIMALAALGQTLNLMTLGGMSLAVGILVDDATVEIENVHRNIAMRKPLVHAILDGAQQIATPAFVATLCICIVFTPVVFISGAARSLFTPLAMAVVFAMLTSYLLSRTLVPTLVHYLLRPEVEVYAGTAHPPRNLIWRVHERFNLLFERVRRSYAGYLDLALDHKRLVTCGFFAFVIGSAVVLFPALGRDFFPTVDAGQIKFHVRTPPGTRIEETEHIFARVEQVVRDVIPRDELVTVIDNIGVPVSGINNVLGDGTLVSPGDGNILVALDPERHGPTERYVKALRERFATDMPNLEIFFQPADITTQVLNFGLSAPIDVQVMGPLRNRVQNIAIARKLRDQIAQIQGAVDVHLNQVIAAPDIKIAVNRTEASQQGLTERDVASDVLISLSSSGQVAPNFWMDPKKGVQYPVAVQTPQYKVGTLNELSNTPISLPESNRGAGAQTLGNLASFTRGGVPVNITHFNAAQTFDVLANVAGADLGSIADQIGDLVARARPTLPRGSTIVIRGQVESMQASFRGLSFGILFAVVLVFLLVAVNFQSWIDPLIILSALPGAISGILWMLFATRTTLSVPALMGAIMSIGVATSNSILILTFANDKRAEGKDAREAAYLAGITRLRPVMMTALAMILGMLPMSLGLGEGGEQNAPLGRAVIGGLCVATLATLIFVPVVYSALRKQPPTSALTPEEMAYGK
ncbi:MAG TPA: efflux RND transporter permease subunit [Kofleriaceae bacterium]|nr:efflux RND transporter permease subunit [Kofleriaceae bacterium]